MRRTRRLLIAGVLTVVAGACGEYSTAADADVDGVAAFYSVDGDVKPMKEACVDPEDPHCLPEGGDPAPEADGYYLGVDYTADFLPRTGY